MVSRPIQDGVYLKLISENFFEIDNAVCRELLQCNDEYIELVELKKEIVRNYPLVESLRDQEEGVRLDEKYLDAYKRYTDVSILIEQIERLHLYFEGHKSCFAYLKEIEAV